MSEAITNPAVISAVALLKHYSFDLGAVSAEVLMAQWQKEYSPVWLRLAVIEALYQGRYKAISVAQILAMWKRRGEPIYHFSYDFERLICRNLAGDNSPLPDAADSNLSQLTEKKEEAKGIRPWQPVRPVVVAKNPPIKEEEITPIVEEQIIEPVQEQVVLETPINDDTNEYLFRPLEIEPYEVDWSKFAGNKQPIEQFIPDEQSDFYMKLKAVSTPELDGISDAIKLEDIEEMEKDLWDD